MKTLISSEEVVELAMSGDAAFRSTSVNEAVILAAQQKFLRPVLNDLYTAIEAGRHRDLLDRYLKKSLANYVKYLLLPSVAAQVGASGVVQPSGQNLIPANDKALSRLMKRIRSDADTLLAVAVEHIEAHAAEYPEYDPHKNILHRTSIAANILI